METSGWFHYPTALHPQNIPTTHQTGGRLNPRKCLDVLEKKIFVTPLTLGHHPPSLVTISTELPSPITSDTSSSLYLLCKWAYSYTIFFFQNVTTKYGTAFRTLMESKGAIFFNEYFDISDYTGSNAEEFIR